VKYLAVIPARAESKGVVNKNVRAIHGHPLIAWSIRQALEVQAISTVVVSTDGQAIAAIASKYGAEVPFLRPAELAQDETPTEPVIDHAIRWYENDGIRHDAVILLQPTSPLRLPGSVQRAIDQFESDGASSLLSVCESHAFFWRTVPSLTASYDFTRRPRRQDLTPEQRWYKETGSIYVTGLDAFRSHRNRLVERISLFEMTDAEGYEVDTETDFVVLDALMSSLSMSLPTGRHEL
jgi:N-acylneuraminate cytidylyltransferase